jgi:recombination protein RecR
MEDGHIKKLEEYFARFPGVGPRQAHRFVYYLLWQNSSIVSDIAHTILNLKKHIGQCKNCFRYFPKDASGQYTLCRICSDSSRDNSILLIVEKDADLENIERTGLYNGNYFVVGGLIPLLETNKSRKIREKELLSRLTHEKSIIELIFALSAHVDGDNTVDYIKKILKPHMEKNEIRITVLGRGLSTGSELEYSDSETLRNALKNRS